MSGKKFYQIDKETTTDVWLTPPPLIESLGTFDLDPCCPGDLPWKTATHRYSLDRGEDGLTLPWYGRVWLNPPYSNWVPFLERLKNHGNGIALLFVRTETEGFFDHIWDGADAVLFIRKRVRFIRLNGAKGNPVLGSILIAYGDNNVQALQRSTLGKFIKLGGSENGRQE